MAEIQESVDQERRAVVREAFGELLADEAEAERFTRFGMYLLIGFEQSGAGQSPETLAWALNLLKETVAGRGSQGVGQGVLP